MGYEARSTDNKFFMKQDDESKAYKALLDLFKIHKKIGWVRDVELDYCDTFEDIMYECGFELEYESESIIGIEFIHEKWEDNDLFLNAIAPFVKSGSYIQMIGEDGQVWREVFENGTCVTKYAKFVFE